MIEFLILFHIANIYIITKDCKNVVTSKGNTLADEWTDTQTEKGFQSTLKPLSNDI